MKHLKKINCIIDTDPGVDDTAAIALSLYDEIMGIKLITTVCGNLDLETVTRNAVHILEKFKRTDIPVAKGASKAMERVSPDAAFIHQSEGMGNYIPPKKVATQTIEKNAVDAMYETILANKNDIVIIALGPHTNLGHLITQHPDVVNMINHIYCEGCAPYGYKGESYISFNVSSDPEAFKIVLESGIPITIIPSRMGRELANLNEKEVFALREINDVGRFLFEMYNGYWEHNYPDRRIALNDTCACMILRFPELFKVKKSFFTVDVGDQPGKTIITFNKKGNVNYAYKVNKKKLHNLFVSAVKKLDNFRFYND
ncbi:MAG: nucleoside hydrolase [Clostridia bacterium]|nr:nucleoside hydrolase [Clostridia bacterium]